MQEINLHLTLNGDPQELLRMLKQLRVVGLEAARLEVKAKVPRSIRWDWLWLNTMRNKDAVRTRDDLQKLVSVGRIDTETKTELEGLISELEALRIWIKDEGMS